jgi:hypothetical protein
MRLLNSVLVVSALASPALAQDILSLDEQAAIFSAAGFERVGGQWQGCGDPGTASYSPGEILEVRDLNGDGLPEAIVGESSAYCFGMTGMGYVLVSSASDGSWRKITEGAGILTVLASTGEGGWPDLEIGGPGFCFPVARWNGREYAIHRHQYEGAPCEP